MPNPLETADNPEGLSRVVIEPAGDGTREASYSESYFRRHFMDRTEWLRRENRLLQERVVRPGYGRAGQQQIGGRWVTGARRNDDGVHPFRKSLAEQHPWLAASVLKAFIAAKEIAMYELGQIGHLFASLPWGVSEFHAARQLMGQDYWSYGFEANRSVLDTFTRYHHEQGLSSRRVPPEALFAASSLDLTKI